LRIKNSVTDALRLYAWHFWWCWVYNGT